jgi:hypothetical protein
MGSGSLFWQERDRPFISGVDLEDARKICRSTTFDNISPVIDSDRWLIRE